MGSARHLQPCQQAVWCSSTIQLLQFKPLRTEVVTQGPNPHICSATPRRLRNELRAKDRELEEKMVEIRTLKSAMLTKDKALEKAEGQLAAVKDKLLGMEGERLEGGVGVSVWVCGGGGGLGSAAGGGSGLGGEGGVA